MKTVNWREEFPAAITVTDKDDIIIEMNQKAADLFSKDGGKALIGKDLLDCHSHLSQEKIKKIQAGKNPNIYTIQKNDIKKNGVPSTLLRKRQVCGIGRDKFRITR